MDFTYLGRDAFDRELLGQIEQTSVLLEGPRGVGKSRVQEHWEQEPPKGWAVLRFDLQGIASAAKLAQQMEEHVVLRRNRIEDWVSTLLEGGWRRSDPWDSLESLLSHRAPQRCLVMFDEIQLYLDGMRRTNPEQARSDLVRLDQLSRHRRSRFVLTGSISLRPIAEQLGYPLGDDWVRIELPPLDTASSEALFQEHCRTACSNVVLRRAASMCGGLPRWIERLARKLTGPASQERTVDDLDRAVELLLVETPFAKELAHLDRHVAAPHLHRALQLAAAEGSNRNAVMAGLQQHLSRSEANRVLDVLQASFLIDAQARIRFPLLGMALRRNNR